MPDDHSASADRRRLELRREQWRRSCRQDLTAFAIEALEPKGEMPASHHRRICHELEAIAHGTVNRLMILAPPGSAKTTYGSRLFPAWFFASRPNTNILAASHTAELAEVNSEFVQRLIRGNAETLGYGLASDARSLWRTTHGCHYRATGATGAILGYRADIALIDDPIRSRQEAESLVARDTLWDWFHADLLTRLKPQGAVVMIATPFHEDDLLGRLLRTQGDTWRVLRLPAIAEDDDALGRQPGEPLWADDAYGYGARLLELRDEYERDGRTRDWYSQYQGRPRPPEGAMFKPGNMPVLESVSLAGAMTVRAWDLAASRQGDWTVGVKLARLRDGGIIVCDVRRLRATPDAVERLLLETAQADGRGTKIWIPEDPGQAGKAQVQNLTGKLMGYFVKSERMTGSKITRAEPCAAQTNVGNVSIVKAPWNAAFLDELAAFPSGSHDDQVDALSLGFGQVMPTSALAVWIALGKEP